MLGTITQDILWTDMQLQALESVKAVRAAIKDENRLLEAARMGKHPRRVEAMNAHGENITALGVELEEITNEERLREQRAPRGGGSR